MWEGWEEVWEEVWRSCAIALRIKLSTARHVDACVGKLLSGMTIRTQSGCPPTSHVIGK